MSDAEITVNNVISIGKSVVRNTSEPNFFYGFPEIRLNFTKISSKNKPSNIQLSLERYLI